MPGAGADFLIQCGVDRHLDVLHLCGPRALADSVAPVLFAEGLRPERLEGGDEPLVARLAERLRSGRGGMVDALVLDGAVGWDPVIAWLGEAGAAGEVPVLVFDQSAPGGMAVEDVGRRLVVRVGGVPSRDVLLDAVRLVRDDARQGRERDEVEVQDRLLAVLRGSRTFVAVVDPDGRVRYLNDAARALAGTAAAADLRGRDIRTLYTVDDVRAVLAEALPGALDHGRWNGRAIVRSAGEGARPAGEGGRTLSVELVAERGEGGVTTGWTIVGHDLGEGLLAPRASASGPLPRTVTHEIGNALTVLIAAAEAALPGTSRSDPYAALARVLDAARWIERILRDPGRPTASRPPPVEVVDVGEVVRETVAIAEAEVTRRARIIVGPTEVPLAVGVPGRIGQVVLNLLLNAAQAIPGGAPTRYRITVGCRVAPDGRVCVDVQDTGVGISPAQLQEIFRPMYSSHRDQSGRGWGLHVVRTLVNEAGGEVIVESRPGEGSRFTIALLPASADGAPARAAPSPEPTPAPSRAPQHPGTLHPAPLGSRGRSVPAPTGPRARLLLVDDEPLLLRAVRRLLVDAYDVELAAGGAEALARFSAGERYDLVLCDLMMPGMGGMDLHAAVGKFDDGQADRMVFLTGGAQSAEAQGFLERVRHPWLRKPFDQATLKAHVRQALTRVGWSADADG